MQRFLNLKDYFEQFENLPCKQQPAHDIRWRSYSKMFRTALGVKVASFDRLRY